jgi:hypothetical protein
MFEKKKCLEYKETLRTLTVRNVEEEIPELPEPDYIDAVMKEDPAIWALQ